MSEVSTVSTCSTAALDDQRFIPTKVFVGGLSHNVSLPELRGYFDQHFGRTIDGAIIQDRASGRSRGFGFVVFEHPRAAEECLAIPRHYISPAISCEVRRAVPRQNIDSAAAVPPVAVAPPPQPTHCCCHNFHKTKVFVSGLHDETITEDVLRSYFGKYGVVLDVCIKFDRQIQQKRRGFGFVIFRDPIAAQSCVGKHPTLGLNVEVKPAVPRRQQAPATAPACPFAKLPVRRYSPY